MKKAVTAFITNNEGQVLAVHRRGDSSDWGLPGGKVDTDESLEQAIIREVKEETGLNFFNVRPIYTRPCHGEEDFETTTFVGEYSGEIFKPTESEEHDEPGVDWVKPRVLLFGSFSNYNLCLYEYMLTHKHEI